MISETAYCEVYVLTVDNKVMLYKTVTIDQYLDREFKSKIKKIQHSEGNSNEMSRIAWQNQKLSDMLFFNLSIRLK